MILLFLSFWDVSSALTLNIINQRFKTVHLQQILFTKQHGDQHSLEQSVRLKIKADKTLRYSSRLSVAEADSALSLRVQWEFRERGFKWVFFVSLTGTSTPSIWASGAGRAERMIAGGSTGGWCTSMLTSACSTYWPHSWRAHLSWCSSSVSSYRLTNSRLCKVTQPKHTQTSHVLQLFLDHLKGRLHFPLLWDIQSCQ